MNNGAAPRYSPVTSPPIRHSRARGNPETLTFPVTTSHHFDTMKGGFVYIMASKRNGTLYTGVTSDLIRRVYEHKTGAVKGFTSRYKIELLVYYEHVEDIEAAIVREKQIKKWNRQWKLELIEDANPAWRDLYEDII